MLNHYWTRFDGHEINLHSSLTLDSRLDLTGCEAMCDRHKQKEVKLKKGGSGTYVLEHCKQERIKYVRLESLFLSGIQSPLTTEIDRNRERKINRHTQMSNTNSSTECDMLLHSNIDWA